MMLTASVQNAKKYKLNRNKQNKGNCEQNRKIFIKVKMKKT